MRKYEKLQVSLSGLTDKVEERTGSPKNLVLCLTMAIPSKIEGKSIVTCLPGRNHFKKLFSEKTRAQQNSHHVAQKKVDFGEFIDSRGVSVLT